MKIGIVSAPVKSLVSFSRWAYRHFFWIFCGGVGVTLVLLMLWFWRGGYFLIVETEVSPSDVVIVLGGGTDRLIDGVRLYHQKYAPHVLFTGGGLQLQLARVHMDWGDIMRNAAEIEGVSPEAIFVDKKSTSTYEDATHTKEILEAHGWTSAIIVSSIYHMRRAKMTFDKVYADSGIRLQYRPSWSAIYHPNRWWKYEADMVYVVSEYMKLVMYWVKY